MNQKITDSQILLSYESTHSVWKTGKELGISGQTVHKRLQSLGANKNTRFTSQEIECIKTHYKEAEEKGFLDLDSLCKKIGREKTTVCGKAKKLGLTCSGRKKSPEHIHKTTEMIKKWRRENEHPRGMLGKKHSKEYCKKISQRTSVWYENASPEKRMQRTMRCIKTKIERYGTAGNRLENIHVSWKQGWREIGDKRIYCRSLWEANYSRYLEFLKEKKEIKEWEHEPKTFWFEKVKRGCVTYLPDFKVHKLDGTHEWHEVKGWMDAKSKTKINRFRKYYPKETLILIDKKWYIKNGKILSGIIKGWEKSRVT